MKTYNERIEELNKEIQERENTGMCNRNNFDRGKIDILNELRAEAIVKVKELQIPIIGLREEAEEEVKRRKAIIDYLIKKWNITEGD